MKLIKELIDQVDRPKKRVSEAFTARAFAKGQVVFSKTQIDDPHIKKAIALIAKKTGASPADIKKDIDKRIAKFDDIATVAPVLYNTIKLNIVENEVFHLMEKRKVSIEKAPQFSFIIFNKLFDTIKIDHDEFFPLRSVFDHKGLHNPRIILVPSPNPENKKFNSIKTAAASEKGEFIFNKPFMQSLLDFAYLKGVRPKGKKYVSNGGTIPDEYCYIEFLIIHELLHFSQGDFHLGRKYKTKPKIINWVGDFRSNYLLVKSGYEQLPMGLFNDEINYDRQKTYKEMIDIVKGEFKKLNAAQKQKVNNQMGQNGDDHSPKKPIEVGDKVKLPDGTPGIVKSITNGRAVVERVNE